MSARGRRTSISRWMLLLATSAALSASACSSDTSGTGDCDPGTDGCGDVDSAVSSDSSRIDSRVDSPPVDSTTTDSTITDSTTTDSTTTDSVTTDSVTDSVVTDSTTTDALDAADTTDAGVDVGTDTRDATTTDAGTDTTPDASDTATADTTDGATADTRDAAADVGTDTRDATVDAVVDVGGDSGLASDPMLVRCRSGTNCNLTESDVCCTPKPDAGGTVGPWRCWDKFTCVTGTGMECDESADCTGSLKCCAASTSATASSCQATCSGVQLCMTNAECGSGKTCVPFTHVSGATLGSCSP